MLLKTSPSQKALLATGTGERTPFSMCLVGLCRITLDLGFLHILGIFDWIGILSAVGLQGLVGFHYVTLDLGIYALINIS